MARSNKYSLDFSSDRVVIDRHAFVPTQYQGMYKSIDSYEVNAGDWSEDERNKGISFRS